jgi:hypothetical protein
MAAMVLAMAVMLLSAHAASAGNLAGDASFEKPVVSGKVSEAAETHLGHCSGLPDEHCWQIVDGPVQLVHDDFQSGGVNWAPYAGHQLLVLPVGPAGGGSGADIVQSVQLVPGGLYKVVIWAAADPRAPLNAVAALGLRMRLCDVSGTICPEDNTLTGKVWRSSTDPAHPNWLKWSIPRLVGQADYPVLRVDLLTPGGLGATANTLIDKFTAGPCPDPAC